MSRVPYWRAETLKAAASDFLSLHGLEASFQTLEIPRPPDGYLSTHHALPEQEAIGCAGPNLEFNGLRYLRQAGEGKQEAMGWEWGLAPVNPAGPRESTNTRLTSGRRCCQGGLGSHCHGNRLHIVQGHLWESGRQLSVRLSAHLIFTSN